VQFAVKIPDEVSLFHRMSLFRRVAIHRFHCIRCGPSMTAYGSLDLIIKTRNLDVNRKRQKHYQLKLDTYGLMENALLG
jgi:hypothetical protein